MEIQTLEDARKYLSPLEISRVIYHGKCLDGFGGAFAAWLIHGDDITYTPMEHGDPISYELYESQNVLIVDFSFPLEDLQRLQKIANRVLILDHHKTAFDRLHKQPGCYFDLKHSGATIAWDFFNPGKTPPLFFNYLEDRDLWRWELKDSPAFIAGLEAIYEDDIRAGNFDFRCYNQFFQEEPLNETIERGKKIVDENNAYIADKCKQAKLYKYMLPNRLVVSVKLLELPNNHLISEIGHALCEDNGADFAMMFIQRDTGDYKLSLRSNGKVDVSMVAAQFGGGGHAQASGMLLKQHPETILEK